MKTLVRRNRASSLFSELVEVWHILFIHCLGYFFKYSIVICFALFSKKKKKKKVNETPLFSKLTEPTIVASSRVEVQREQREETKRRGLLNARTNSTEARKRRGCFPRTNVSDTTNRCRFPWFLEGGSKNDLWRDNGVAVEEHRGVP